VQGHYLAATFCESLVSHSQPKNLLLWNATDLSIQSTSTKLLSTNRVLADQVKFLIGAYGQRLVFLDSNGWACSVDLGIRNVERHTRHFFIPFDWLSAGAELTIDVTCNGDIIFVKRHEISVKRSLEASEQGPNTAGARSTIRVAPRPSLASSRSSGLDDICLRPYTEEKRSSLPVGPTKWSEDMFPWSL